MEIGNLFKSKQNLPTPEYFLGIQIQEGIVKTAVWQVQDKVPSVKSYGSIEKWSDVDSLVVATDTSLATALEGQEIEPDRVIFGLPDSWVKEDKINSEFAPFLKELIAKLELKPIGFVVITEAIIQQLKATEGIPPTAIFLELHSTKVNVVVVNLGETLGKEEVGRSDDLAKDVQEALARINLDNLPVRMIIIDGEEPDLEQQLTSFPWQEQLPFLHLPKVEVPDPQFSIKAVAISGGSQAAKSLGIEIHDPEEEVVAKSNPVEEEEVSSSEALEAPLDSLKEPVEASSQDDALDGFVIGQDIREFTPPSADEPTQISELSEQGKSSSKLSFTPLLTKLKNLPSFSLASSSSLTLQKYQKPALFAIPVALVLLLFTSAFAFSYFTTANITILVDDKEIDKSFEIAIADSPQDLPTLPATNESLELTATDSISTSGEALVGEKATGEVNIFNKTDSPKNLTAGTIITTSNNLKFTLDTAVTIASQSSQIKSDGSGEETIYGQAKVKVTASAIGADANLDKDTEFSIGSFPKTSLLAKSTTNFSGGTSRTVKAVSKKDQETLLNKLKEEINNQAKDKLSSSEDFQIVSQGVEIVKEDFSHKVNEEAGTVSLTLVAKANFLKFATNHLNDLLNDQLKTDIPAGYVLGASDSQITVDTPTSTEDDDVVTTNAHIKASLLPDLPISDYQQKLKGKSVEKAQNLMQDIEGLQKIIIEISPRVPFLSKNLPRNPDKITLTIQKTP